MPRPNPVTTPDDSAHHWMASRMSSMQECRDCLVVRRPGTYQGRECWEFSFPHQGSSGFYPFLVTPRVGYGYLSEPSCPPSAADMETRTQDRQGNPNVLDTWGSQSAVQVFENVNPALLPAIRAGARRVGGKVATKGMGGGLASLRVTVTFPAASWAASRDAKQAFRESLSPLQIAPWGMNEETLHPSNAPRQGNPYEGRHIYGKPENCRCPRCRTVDGPRLRLKDLVDQVGRASGGTLGMSSSASPLERAYSAALRALEADANRKDGALIEAAYRELLESASLAGVRTVNPRKKMTVNAWGERHSGPAPHMPEFAQDATNEQKEALVEWFAEMTLPQLRRRQSITQQQIPMASRNISDWGRREKVIIHLQTNLDLLHDAVSRVAFKEPARIWQRPTQTVHWDNAHSGNALCGLSREHGMGRLSTRPEDVTCDRCIPGLPRRGNPRPVTSDGDWVQTALRGESVLDIGQIPESDRRTLKALVRQGKLVECWNYDFPIRKTAYCVPGPPWPPNTSPK